MATDALARSLARLHRALGQLEDAVLALLLGTAIVLASVQIFLRGLFEAGIGWIDPLVRVIVLWLGMLGAVAASRSRRQITIDAVSRLLPERARAAVGAGTSLVTAVVAGFLAYHAGRFVASELEFGSAAFSGIPAWQLETVLPFAFGAIALRYAAHAVADLRQALSGKDATG